MNHFFQWAWKPIKIKKQIFSDYVVHIGAFLY